MHTVPPSAAPEAPAERTAAAAARDARSAIALTLLWCALCGIPLATLSLAAISRLSMPCDFVTYWSAARLFLAHRSPYDPHLVLPVQQAVGWPFAQPVVMFCPMWTLPVVAACGLLPFATAQLLWLIVSIVLDGISAIALWRYFGGAWSRAWIALLVVLTFYPLNASERVGQITPLMLLALTAMLWLLRKRQWFLAGICTIGFGAKPHLLWLVLLALVAWCIQQRRWRLLTGAAGMLALFTAAAVAWDPAAGRYFQDIYGVAISTNCGIGAVLRMIFGEQKTWLQYVPCACGAAWFGWYWMRHRATWSWTQDLPLLLLVSIASSPYCWYRDYILALPTFIFLAARGAWRSPRVMVLWLLVQALVVAAPNEPEKALASVLWIAFWLLALRELNRTPHFQPEPAAVPA